MWLWSIIIDLLGILFLGYPLVSGAWVFLRCCELAEVALNESLRAFVVALAVGAPQVADIVAWIQGPFQHNIISLSLVESSTE